MSGRGKGGKGLGKGGAKRHRKILRDNIQGITKPAIRRLARRGGVKRISGLIYEETRGVLKIFLENVIRDSVTYTEHAKRKTVTALDVVYALKRSGRTLYGFGVLDGPQLIIPVCTDDRTADITTVYQAALDFQFNNHDGISKTEDRFASLAGVKAIEDKVNDLATSSQVLMDILDDVRKIHPIIDVVVLAFKAVVVLQIKRGENDQKVLVLRVKMQDMMEIFVQLRAISPEQESKRGFTVAESLKKLCDKISDDIWSCANLCDVYFKKATLVKLLKSPIYEGRFASYIDTFAERRNELHTALAMFTAYKMQSTLSTLETNQDMLKSIQESVKLIFEKLRNQSALEKELWKTIEAKGGLEKCIQDDSALGELIKIDASTSLDDTGENPAVPGSVHRPRTNSVGATASYSVAPSPYAAGHSVGPTPSYSAGPTSYSVGPTPTSYSAGPTSYSVGPTPSYSVGPTPSYSVGASPAYSVPGQPIPMPSLTNLRHRSYSHHSSRSRSRRPSSHRDEEEIPMMVPSPGFVASGPSYEPTPSRSRRPSRHSGYEYPIPQPPSGQTDYSGYPGPDPSRTYTSAASMPYPMDNIEMDLQPPQRVINDLKEELKNNIDDDLKKNMVVFRRKLDEQRRQLAQVGDEVVRQGNRLASAIDRGPHDRIYDPGWKLGVPVQEFVHTLHDYYVAQASDSSLVDEQFNKPPLPGSTREDQTIALQRAFTAAKRRAAEKWALQHINIKNIVPLGEVFDGDASGYVSVWEANQVASLRPTDWSFLQWLAYWAAGRHFTIWQYRRKIGAIIIAMHKSLEDILPTNTAVVNRYLDFMVFVDRILYQIRPYPEEPDSLFAEQIAAYTRTEEDVMQRKLEALSYEIDGPDTLRLIIGESQIERNLFPLLYLLLKRHLGIIRAGIANVFDREEFFIAEETLDQIFSAVNIRIQTLQWLFTNDFSSPIPPTPRLQTFAYGMYHNLLEGTSPYMLPVDYDIPKELEVDLESIQPVEQLKYPAPKIVDAPKDTIRPVKLGDYVTGVEGSWTGHLFNEDDVPIHGMLDLRVHKWNFSDGVFEGSGDYPQGTISVVGTIEIQRQQGTVKALLIAKPDYRKDQSFKIFLRGKLDITRYSSSKSTAARSLPPQYTISGEWGYSSNESKVCGSFYLSQTPAWAHHFRSRIVKPGERGRVKSLWDFACSAILHQVYAQKALLRKETVREMLQQLKRGAEMSRYQYLLTDTESFNRRDQKEMNKLLLTCTPWNWRFYRSVARTHFDWATLHHNNYCDACQAVILGDRYYCYTCSATSGGTSIDFCSTCRHDHDKNAYIGHAYIKLRKYNYSRDTLHLSDRTYMLSIRSMSPGPQGPVIMMPTASSESSVRSRSPRPLEVKPKRVRFSLGALRSSSGQSEIRSHRRRANSITAGSGWGLPHNESMLSPGADSTTEETVVGEAEDQEQQSIIPILSTNRNLGRCISCNEQVDLGEDVYWSCIICSEPSLDKKAVVCAECELRNRPVPPAKSSPTTGEDTEQKNHHTLDHPILRVHGRISRPLSPSVDWDSPWAGVGISDGLGTSSTTSKRRMALEFVKGLIRGKKLSSSAWDTGTEWDAF
ncbi:hypothetical protein D9757_012745 [Collybiopsis confluens]|uniref:Histone H4 n=3 Tax=Fungi TaxID=4751 RepID=A0A8H5GH57_9AGAR|nr:hypothetical protein D9757_012745 [Collybiopsis confluens]